MGFQVDELILKKKKKKVDELMSGSTEILLMINA